MKRTFDATFLNHVANHPSVRPFVGGNGEIDTGIIVNDPDNYAFEFEHGGMIAVSRGGGVFEVHIMALPAGRGKTLVEVARHCMARIFAAGCAVLVGKVKRENRPLRALANALGWVRTAADDNIIHYALTRDQWRALPCQ